MKKKLKNFIMYFKCLSLIKKFLLSYLVVFAIPVIIGASLFSSQIRQNVESEALNRSWQDSRQIKSDVLNSVELCKNSLHTAINTTNLVDYLDITRKYSLDEILFFRDNILPNVGNIINYSASINDIRLFIANKNMNELIPTILYESRIIDQPWFKDLYDKKGKVLWRISHLEDDFNDKSDRRREVVSFYRETKLYDMHIATAEVNMLTEKFFGNVYANQENDNYFIYIIKGNNTECWNRKSKFFKKYDIDPLELKSDIIDNTKSDEGTFNFKYKNIKFLVTYTYNEYMDIYIYQLVALNDINSGIKNINIISIVTIIATIGLFTLITYFITSALLKKLKVVMFHMRRVQNGEMFTEIPINDNDEIDELSNHFNVMMNKINELIFTIVKKEAVSKNAEIQALHSQINAHFIYNVLEAIKMMAVVEFKYDIADALTALGRLLRYNINWKHKYVTLEDEVNHIKNYISLLNLRFNNNINLNIDIPNYLLKHEVLKMLLQPLVENSVNHGLVESGKEGNINIHAFNEDNYLYLEVKDNGSGIDQETMIKLRKSIEEGEVYQTKNITGNGIGLENVNERVKLFYGYEFGIQIESRVNEYTIVRIKLPYLLSKDNT